MVMRNYMDQFHLVADVIDRVRQVDYHAACAKQAIRDKLIEHKEYSTTYGDDLPKIREWRLTALWIIGAARGQETEERWQ
jgi:xylulose-5-phosphate/fructose-6-phosphate phosphoketolase